MKKTLIEDRTNFAVLDAMENREAKQSSWSEAERSSKADIQHMQLLEHVAAVFNSVQNLGNKIVDGFTSEGLRRQEGNNKLKEEMYTGFKNEQQARQQMQREIAQGFKYEENARQLVRNNFEVMREETQKLQQGSGSSVFDLGKDMEFYEACISNVIKSSSRRTSRRCHKKNTGDLTVELGVMCTDKNDIK